MTMRRADFKAIAEIIRKYNLKGGNSFDLLDLYEMNLEFSSYFKKANPTFDKGKYFKACGFYQE